MRPLAGEAPVTELVERRADLFGAKLIVAALANVLLRE